MKRGVALEEVERGDEVFVEEVLVVFAEDGDRRGLDGADARRRRQRARLGQRVADAGEVEEPVLPENRQVAFDQILVVRIERGAVLTVPILRWDGGPSVSRSARTAAADPPPVSHLLVSIGIRNLRRAVAQRRRFDRSAAAARCPESARATAASRLTPPEVAVMVQVPVLTGAVQINVHCPAASAVVCALPDFSIEMAMTASRAARSPSTGTARPRRTTGWLSLMVMDAVCGERGGREQHATINRSLRPRQRGLRRSSRVPPAIRPRAPGPTSTASPALRDSFGASGELEHRQTDAVDFELVGPRLRREADCRRRGRSRSRPVRRRRR